MGIHLTDGIGSAQKLADFNGIWREIDEIYSDVYCLAGLSIILRNCQ